MLNDGENFEVILYATSQYIKAEKVKGYVEKSIELKTHIPFPGGKKYLIPTSVAIEHLPNDVHQVIVTGVVEEVKNEE